VATSWEAGELYTFMDPDVGDDLQRIVDNANRRLHWIWQHDLPADLRRAEEEFRARVGEPSDG